MEQDKNWWPTVIDSALGAIPVVGATAQNAFAAWRNKNISVARDVLLSNIRAGDVFAIQQDEFFSMLARFSRSVQEGVAKRNLILLAKLISGMGNVEKQECKSDVFARYASMLEYLNIEELKYLANFINYYSKPGKERVLWSMEEIKLQENDIAKGLVQKGVFISDFEVWQEKHDDWKVPSEFPSDIHTKRTYYLSDDMQEIISKYAIKWDYIANMNIQDVKLEKNYILDIPKTIKPNIKRNKNTHIDTVQVYLIRDSLSFWSILPFIIHHDIIY